MLLLMVADTHNTLTNDNIPDDILTADIDAVFLLGDVSSQDIAILKSKFQVPFFGVGGNHDTWDQLTSNGVEDLHARVIRWRKLTIAGFGGSLRYKETPHYMFFTEQEARDLLSQMPACDILITHAAPKSEDIQPEQPVVSEKESFLTKISSLFAKPATNPYASHEPDTSAPMYRGFYAISEYIQKHHPNFVLHGHIHESDTNWEGSTCVRSFYGLELFEIEI